MNLNERIFEDLIIKDKSKSDVSDMNWLIQNQIAATNGIHYTDRLGKLLNIPEYNLPQIVNNRQGLMLDIGAGWGRWLRAGAAKGMIPVGIDIRLAFCKTQQEYLKSLNLKGYSVVADLEEIPFRDGVFDLVWSFSVIQHTHRIRLENCLIHIDRILKNNGNTVLEFPNKNGVRNRIVNKKFFDNLKDHYESWDVRYYTLNEYREIFEKHLTNFKSHVHSFIGIGILPEDKHYVSLKYLPFVLLSNWATWFVTAFGFFKDKSDSFYLKASKKEFTQDADLKNFMLNHHSIFDNLNILKLMRCPISNFEFEIDETRTKALAPEAKLYYPIVNDIPIIIKSEAVYY